MLQNAYFLAKIGADTAENEQHYAEILPTTLRVRRATVHDLRALKARYDAEVHPARLQIRHSKYYSRMGYIKKFK